MSRALTLAALVVLAALVTVVVWEVVLPVRPKARVAVLAQDCLGGDPLKSRHECIPPPSRTFTTSAACSPGTPCSVTADAAPACCFDRFTTGNRVDSQGRLNANGGYVLDSKGSPVRTAVSH